MPFFGSFQDVVGDMRHVLFFGLCMLSDFVQLICEALMITHERLVTLHADIVWLRTKTSPDFGRTALVREVDKLARIHHKRCDLSSGLHWRLELLINPTLEINTVDPSSTIRRL